MFECVSVMGVRNQNGCKRADNVVDDASTLIVCECILFSVFFTAESQCRTSTFIEIPSEMN